MRPSVCGGGLAARFGSEVQAPRRSAVDICGPAQVAARDAGSAHERTRVSFHSAMTRVSGCRGG
jgi:hypothetical protein